MQNNANNPLGSNGALFLSDGGLETSLIFHEEIELPHFAAFVLVDSKSGRKKLRRYYRRYAGLARQLGMGLILESPTWRASRDWGKRLGYSSERLANTSMRAIDLMRSIGAEVELGGGKVVVSGCVGPRGDGYTLDQHPTVESSEQYHRDQIRALAAAGADVITAMTLTCSEEAVGICRATIATGAPIVISFTVETDGRLPSGESLKEAIVEVDAATDGAPVYYMINCAHPTHFPDNLDTDEMWIRRIQGVRSNASACSHAELDEATELDDGDPDDLAARYAELDSLLPNLRVLGGCCGTDHRHVGAIAREVVGSRTQTNDEAVSC
jgi:S-methylmethionine-dependent homocysteine/selenocysteine methylase